MGAKNKKENTIKEKKEKKEKVKQEKVIKEKKEKPSKEKKEKLVKVKKDTKIKENTTEITSTEKSSENKEKDGKMKTKKTDKSSEKSKNAIQNMFAKIVKKTTASEVTKEPQIIEIDIDEDNVSREEEKNTIPKSDTPITNIEDQATVGTPTQK